MRKCKGMNCGATDGISHSAECQAEHAASVAGGVFVKQPVGTLEGLASDLIARQQPLGDEVTRVLSENMSALYEGAQPVSAAEVPMPEVHDYGYHDADNGWIETLACDEADVLTYGDAREAAGYARGVKAAAPYLGTIDDALRNFDAALRGEVKP